MRQRIRQFALRFADVLGDVEMDILPLAAT
jgi:hypothetical protein